MELKELKGVGPKTLQGLLDLGINSIDDLVRYYPYRYNVYKPINIRDCIDNSTITIIGRVVSKPSFFRGNKVKSIIRFKFETSNNIINVTIFNQPYLTKSLYINKELTLVGKYDELTNTFTVSKIFNDVLDKTLIEGVYHSSSNINRSSLVKLINNVLLADYEVKEIIPSYINDKYELMNTKDALKVIHNPIDNSSYKKALLKLKYEELFEFMFKINILKIRKELNDNFVIKDFKDDSLNRILSLIPFELTKGQMDAINEIIEDFRSLRRMNRLVLGDVGSGKTIVAFISLILNKESGYQGCMIAPTEVLAIQHFENFKSLFNDLDIKVELLTGNTSKAEKNRINKELLNGDIDILIGTHALLEDNIEFNNLGLVVTDEQHRFGVNQRNILRNKGEAVDVLYMSATPIPRTYALTIYGDMDISLIKDKPKNRKEIRTLKYTFKDLDKAFDIVNEELNNNHQVYIVSPLIEDEESDINDINNIKELVNKYLVSNKKVGILHGKLKNVEKDKIINSFKEGKIDVLISTTVIEVGVDVSNATCILIFNAERFGLSTLHQLRGRVGRNSLESKCILLSDKNSERFDCLVESNDGFYISEMDLKLRGSGDLFGIRQHGDMSFKIANIVSDNRILLQCKKDSEEFIKDNIDTNFSNYSYYRNIVNELVNKD